MAMTLNYEASSNCTVTARQAVDEETPLLREDSVTKHMLTAEAPSNQTLALVLGTTFVGVFFGAIDMGIISTLSASITTSFNSFNLFAWVASASMIANAACQPLLGRLTDIFGRRAGLLISSFLFAVGNLICGLAGTGEVLILGRVVSGLGAGGIMAIANFVASDLVPLRKRGMVQGLSNFGLGIGGGVGGLCGGWISDNWGWRNAFLAQVPPTLASTILVYFFIDIPPRAFEKSKLSRVDFLGAFTLTFALVSLLFGMSLGGNSHAWNDSIVISTLLCSVAALATFIWIERNAREPIIPINLMLNRTVASACLNTWFGMMAIFAITFYVPIWFQIRGHSATAAGTLYIAHAAGVAVVSLTVGFVMKGTGEYRILGLVVMAFFTMGTGLLSSVTLLELEWPVSVAIFMAGVGYGGMNIVNLLACISAVAHEHQAVITSAIYVFRSTGSTIGISIASTIYQNVLKAELWARFGDEEDAARRIGKILDNFDELKNLSPHWREGALESYMDSLRAVFVTCLGLAFLSIVCQCFVKQYVLYSTMERK